MIKSAGQDEKAGKGDQLSPGPPIRQQLHWFGNVGHILAKYQVQFDAHAEMPLFIQY